MKDFAEFEPSFWQEDGILMDLEVPVFGAVGTRVAALFAAVAISLGSVGAAQELSFRIRDHASAHMAPITSRPFEPSVRVARDDRDAVSPGYWDAMRTLLKTLPSLPQEPNEADAEPLI